MPSLVSMPPNIITAAFEAASAVERVAVASASTPRPRSIVFETSVPRARTASRAPRPISPPVDTRSTAATISSYQPRTTEGSASRSSSAPVTTLTARGPARSRRISARPAGASFRHQPPGLGVDPAREAGPRLRLEKRPREWVAMTLVLVAVERQHARTYDLGCREARVIDGEATRHRASLRCTGLDASPASHRGREPRTPVHAPEVRPARRTGPCRATRA